MTQSAQPQIESRRDALRAALPKEQLFSGKDWLFSPHPLVLEKKLVREIESLGRRLEAFVKACNLIYQRSVKGSLPDWIHNYLDAGKPDDLVNFSRSKELREALPRVLRPDLLLGESGFAMSELDNVPGGIGLTAWLSSTYANLGESNLVGGPRGMIEGFRSILPDGADIVVSDESRDYRPEMQWLCDQLNSTGKGDAEQGHYVVHRAEDYRPEPGDREIYRFFEMFDLPNIPFASQWVQNKDAADAARITPPLKPYLEEKLWMALFWSVPLRDVWRRELRDSGWQQLRATIPFSLVADPTPLPHHGVLPRLELNRFQDVANLSQKDRDLVLKISGFSELAWGSRGVHIGADLSQADWSAAVMQGLSSFDSNPYVLQEFKRAKVFEHPYWDPETGQLRTMQARARLCPYFFVTNQDSTEKQSVVLGGVLATIVPADKKLLHGMRDAIMVPCAIGE